MLNTKQDLIYAKEVGKILGRCEQTINTYRKQGGKLPPHSNFGGQYVWRRSDIEFLANCWPKNMAEFNKRMNS